MHCQTCTRVRVHLLTPAPLRAETFQTDAAALLKLINSRRDPRLPALEFDAQWRNRGISHEQRLQRLATKLRAYLGGTTFAGEKMEVFKNGLQRLGLDINDRAGLENALAEVNNSLQQVAGKEEQCNPDLAEEELLACEQRRYAKVWRECGLGCVRAFARFIKPDLEAGGYDPGWPLNMLPSRPPSRQRLADHRA